MDPVWVECTQLKDEFLYCGRARKQRINFRVNHPRKMRPRPVSRKSRWIYGPEKPFVILRPAYSVMLVFSCVVKGIKTRINWKVSCLETPSFWRFEESYVTRNAPEKFRDFGDTGPNAWISCVHQTTYRRILQVFSPPPPPPKKKHYRLQRRSWSSRNFSMK